MFMITKENVPKNSFADLYLCRNFFESYAKKLIPISWRLPIVFFYNLKVILSILYVLKIISISTPYPYILSTYIYIYMLVLKIQTSETKHMILTKPFYSIHNVNSKNIYMKSIQWRIFVRRYNKRSAFNQISINIPVITDECKIILIWFSKIFLNIFRSFNGNSKKSWRSRRR